MNRIFDDDRDAIGRGHDAQNVLLGGFREERLLFSRLHVPRRHGAAREQHRFAVVSERVAQTAGFARSDEELFLLRDVPQANRVVRSRRERLSVVGDRERVDAVEMRSP